VLIQIFAGEKEMTVDNNFLGYLQLKEISSTPRRVLQIEVTFDIDANSFLNVTAVEKLTEKGNQITINKFKRQISKDFYGDEGEKQMQQITARNALEAYCYKIISEAEDLKNKGKLSVRDRNLIVRKCNEVLCWLNANQRAEKEVIESQQKQLESVLNKIKQKGTRVPLCARWNALRICCAKYQDPGAVEDLEAGAGPDILEMH
jgi:L1 cell adhesion molecule like protein